MKHKIGFFIPIAFLFTLVFTCDLSSRIHVSEAERIDTNIRKTSRLIFPPEQPPKRNDDCSECYMCKGTSIHFRIDPVGDTIWRGSLIDASHYKRVRIKRSQYLSFTVERR